MRLVGPGTAADGGKQEAGKIVVVEVGADKAIPWTKPEDVTPAKENPAAAFGTATGDVFPALFGDSHVELIEAKIEPAKLAEKIFEAAGDAKPESK